MQIDKKTLSSLLETLNSIICEDNLLTYDQRENMVKTVATVGSLIERTNGNTVKPEAPKKVKKHRMPSSIDPKVPNSGKPLNDN